jgi:hypothetical protein
MLEYLLWSLVLGLVLDGLNSSASLDVWFYDVIDNDSKEAFYR